MLIERPSEENGRMNGNETDWEERIYDYDGVSRIARQYDSGRSSRRHHHHHRHHHNGRHHQGHRSSPRDEAQVQVHQPDRDYDMQSSSYQQRFIHHFDTVRPLNDQGDRDSVSGSSMSTVSVSNVGVDRPPEIPPRPRHNRSYGTGPEQYAVSSRHHRHRHHHHHHRNNTTLPRESWEGANSYDHRHRSYHEGGALD